MMMELPEILGDCMGALVNGDELGNALRSIREREGIEIDFSRRDHLGILLSQLAETKGLSRP